MRITGIGTDIIDCLRIAKMIELHGETFLRQVYTQREIEYCSSRKFKTEQYAARWAGKRAVMQAISTKVRPSEIWCDIEIRAQHEGQFPVALGGIARQICLAQGIHRVIASISFCRHYATGYAMAISDEDDHASPGFAIEAEDWPAEDWEPDDEWSVDDDIPF